MDWTFTQLLKRQTPICAPCEEEGEDAVETYGINDALESWGLPKLEGEVKKKVVVFESYEIKDRGCFNLDVWAKVLFRNDVQWSRTGKPGKLDPPWANSLLGETGHIERANAWTHIAGGLLYMAYLAIRPYTPQGATHHLSDALAYVALGAYVFTFFMSACYHVYSANYVMSAVTRLGDYFGIYLGISAGTLADISLTSRNLELASWQSVADVWIGMAVLVAFFVYRRTQIPIYETRRAYMSNKCSLGLARSTNVDLSHSGLRAAAGLAMALGWVHVIPAAFSTLELDCAWFFAGGRFVGTALLILGMFLDNVVLYPDAYEIDASAPPKFLTFTEPCGCICTSHAIWHVVALLSIVVTTAGSEYALANTSGL